MSPGIYRYLVARHALELEVEGDVRAALARAALDQDFIAEAPASIVMSAVYERTTRRYGRRGYRYVHMDVGHAGENVHLQAVALGFGTVVVGAFDDEEVKRALRLPEEQHPLYIMPIGRPR